MLLFRAHLAAHGGDHPVLEGGIGLGVPIIFFEQVVHMLNLLVGRAGGGIGGKARIERSALGGGQLAVNGGGEQLVERFGVG
jgi:hypothetical protein